MLVGTFAGVAVSAALIADGVLQLDRFPGGCVHYAGALALAALLGVPARWRRGAQPLAATAIMALLATFAFRRWLTVWINLEPLDFGSGPGGNSTAIVFPLDGLILGAVLAVDSLRSGSTGEPGAIGSDVPRAEK
jgi:hypothetical protein